MNRSRSSGKLESQGHRNMSDEQLYKLILKVYEETRDLEQLQTTIRGIMIDDPERIRVAYRRVVEMKGRGRTASEHRPEPPHRSPIMVLMEPRGSGSSRQSQRRKSGSTSKAGKNCMSVVIDASGMRESGTLESLKAEMSALCRVQHQNLLNLASFTAMKGTRFTLDFDLANTSHVTLLDMFQEEAESSPLNGCEVACVLAQVCLGMLFLLDCAVPVLEPMMELNPGECLLTENIILTDRGLIKLCGHHTVLRLPRRPPALSGGCNGDGNEDSEPREQPRPHRPGFLAHRVAMLLYELDHTSHQALCSLRSCSAQERRLLDERYARLFSQCAEWDPDTPVDLRSVLYSTFISEQTSAITSYQSPLEFVFASRFG